MQPRLSRTLLVALAAVVTAFAAGCGDDAPPDGETTSGAGAAGGGGEGGGGAGGAGGGTGDACADLEAALTLALDESRLEANSAGAVLAVETPRCGLWVGASGESTTGDPMRPEHVFRIGSVTKTYVSAALLALAHEGALELDDPLSTWVPSFPDGDGITVRQVLNHTSGIYDYMDLEFIEAALSNPGQEWTPEELVDGVSNDAPYFPPGEGWHYSNTNYILAGMIVEAASGKGVAEVIRERFLEPLSLTSTAMDGEEPIAGDLAHGYTTGMVDATYSLHPSVTWAAGAMVASTGDVARWAGALYGGAALDPASLSEMLADPAPTGSDGASYGLGVIVLMPPVAPVEMVGHAGGLPGYVTLMYYLPEQQASVVAIVNADASDPALVLGPALDIVLAAE